jgi:RNA polymerase sigma-70 factor (ECF subfamily)
MIGPGFDSVLQRAREGDDLAWSALYDDLAGQLLGYLRGRGAPEPEDQVGETFLQVARDLPSFTGDEIGFRSWVFTIAHRRMLDASRSRRRRPLGLLPAERLSAVAEALESAVTTEMEEAIARIADAELLTGLLAHLSEEQREVLLLRFGSDLDTATVGEITGRSANAVAAITRRGLARLRDVIEAAGGPGEASASRDGGLRR